MESKLNNDLLVSVSNFIFGTPEYQEKKRLATNIQRWYRKRKGASFQKNDFLRYISKEYQESRPDVEPRYGPTQDE